MRDDETIGRALQAAFPGVDSQDPVGFFGQIGDVFGALSYAYLFWPKLIEIHGAVFVAVTGDYEGQVRERLAVPAAQEEARPLAWKEVVDSFNWFEISQLFGRWREPRDFTDDAYEGVGGFLVESWGAKLRLEFPDREFEVRLLEADEQHERRISVRQTSPPLLEPRGWDSGTRHIRNS
jgi:hypothetical protein